MNTFNKIRVMTVVILLGTTTNIHSQDMTCTNCHGDSTWIDCETVLNQEAIPSESYLQILNHCLKTRDSFYEVFLLHNDYDWFQPINYNTPFSPEVSYPQIVKTKLTTIRNGAFYVVPPISSGISATLDWTATAETVPGNFEIFLNIGELLADFPFPIYDIQMTAKSGGATYYGSTSTGLITISNVAAGTKTYALEMCLTFLNYYTMMMETGCYGQTNKSVTVNPTLGTQGPEPYAYVIDENNTYESDPNNCNVGYLGFQSISSPEDQVCVAGQKIDEDFDASYGYEDVVLCNQNVGSFGACVSGKSQVNKSHQTDAYGSQTAQMGTIRFDAVVGFCKLIDGTVQEDWCEYLDSDFMPGFDLKDIWRDIFGDGQGTQDCKFEPNTGRYCVSVTYSIDPTENTVVTDGSGGLRIQISNQLPNFSYPEIRQSYERHEEKHVQDNYNLAKNPEIWQCPGLLEGCPQNGRIIATVGRDAALFVEGRAYTVQKQFLESAIESTNDQAKKDYIQEFIEDEVDPALAVIEIGWLPQ